MLKRYIVFAYKRKRRKIGRPTGGWHDVLSEDFESASSFDTAEEARDAAGHRVLLEENFHIVDLHTGRIVETG